MAKETEAPCTYYVIGIGGSGGKVMESMVYAAALDLFVYAGQGANGAGDRVIPKVEMLVLDVDASCGNTDRMHDVLLHYQEIQKLWPKEAKHRGFNTELIRKSWTTDSGQTAGVEALVYNNPEEQLLAHAIYSKGESQLAYDKGFHGHPNLGVLFFRFHLDQLDQKKAQEKEDEINKTLALIRRDLLEGKVVRVLIAGSVFGGTGASGIPQITRFIREHFNDMKEREQLLIGGIFMLPFYHVPETQQVEYELTVASSNFMEKAGTALQHYGDQRAIRQKADPLDAGEEKGLFDAIYLLGLPEDQFLYTRRYASGSKEQMNDAHLLEWLATCCAAHFFYTDFIQQDNRDCYHYEMHANRFDWTCFSTDTERYRRAYKGLMDASALFVAECYPTICRELKKRDSLLTSAVHYYAAYFMGARDMASGCSVALDHLFAFLKYYVVWMCQVLRTMPPQMRDQTAWEKELQKTLDEYARLLARQASTDALMACMARLGYTDKIILCQQHRDALNKRKATFEQICKDADDAIKTMERPNANIPDDEIDKLKSSRAAAAEEVRHVTGLRNRNQDVLTRCLMLQADPAEVDAGSWEIPANDLFDAKWLQDLEQMFIDTAGGPLAQRESSKRGRYVLGEIEKREELLMRLGCPSERITRKALPAKRVSAFIANLLYGIGGEDGP